MLRPPNQPALAEYCQGQYPTLGAVGSWSYLGPVYFLQMVPLMSRLYFVTLTLAEALEEAEEVASPVPSHPLEIYFVTDQPLGMHSHY